MKILNIILICGKILNIIKKKKKKKKKNKKKKKKKKKSSKFKRKFCLSRNVGKR